MGVLHDHDVIKGSVQVILTLSRAIFTLFIKTIIIFVVSHNSLFRGTVLCLQRTFSYMYTALIGVTKCKSKKVLVSLGIPQFIDSHFLFTGI